MKIEPKYLFIPVMCTLYYIMYGLNVLIGLILIILSHELGHALVAYEQGIFKRFDITDSGNPAVATEGDFNNKIDYFAGIFFNAMFIPILSELFATSWINCGIICLGMGMLDIVKVGHRWKEEREQSESQNRS